MIPTYKWELWPVGDGGCGNFWGSRVKGRWNYYINTNPQCS